MDIGLVVLCLHRPDILLVANKDGKHTLDPAEEIEPIVA